MDHNINAPAVSDLETCRILGIDDKHAGTPGINYQCLNKIELRNTDAEMRVLMERGVDVITAEKEAKKLAKIYRKEAESELKRQGKSIT